MKNRILFLLLLLWVNTALLLQKNEMEAKASYLLAEENYLTGKYKEAYTYIDNAEKQLGSTNCKLLYLKILIETEVYKSDVTYFPHLMNSISLFQSHPSVNTFTSEKVIEISKLKLTLLTEEQKRVNLKEYQEALDLKFKNYSIEGWPTGIDFLELSETHKDSVVFNRKLKPLQYGYVKDGIFTNNNQIIYGPKKGGGYGLAGMEYFGNLHLPNPYFTTIFKTLNKGVVGIITDRNTVKGYRRLVYSHFNYRFPVTTNTSLSYEEAVRGVATIVKEFSDQFGFPPKKISTAGVIGVQSVNNIFQWTRNNKTVVLYVCYAKENNYNWSCYIMQDVLEY